MAFYENVKDGQCKAEKTESTDQKDNFEDTFN